MSAVREMLRHHKTRGQKKVKHIYIYIYIWADGFSGVPRISPVLGRTVSGSTFLFLDLFLLLVEVAGSKVLRLAAGRNLEKDD